MVKLNEASMEEKFMKSFRCYHKNMKMYSTLLFLFVYSE